MSQLWHWSLVSENDLGKEAVSGSDVNVISATMESMSVESKGEVSCYCSYLLRQDWCWWRDVCYFSKQPTSGGSVSSSQLAQAPSRDELFGAIDDIKQQYQQTQAVSNIFTSALQNQNINKFRDFLSAQEYEKTQELNRTRMQQGLQEKLAARRSRAARQG